MVYELLRPKLLYSTVLEVSLVTCFYLCGNVFL